MLVINPVLQICESLKDLEFVEEEKLFDPEEVYAGQEINQTLNLALVVNRIKRPPPKWQLQVRFMAGHH